jgi:hypothetical protein
MLSTRLGAVSAIHPKYRCYISTTAAPRLEPYPVGVSPPQSTVVDIGEEEEENEEESAVCGSTAVFVKPEPSVRKEPDLIAARVVVPLLHCTTPPPR